MSRTQKQKWREQKNQYRQRNRTFSLSFPNGEASHLEGLAQDRRQTPATFLKSVIRAYTHGNGYVLPPDGRLQELSQLIRSVATNVNQTVRYIHTNRLLTYSDIQQLQQKLVFMEHKIEQALSLPPSIESVLKRHLKQYPETKESLIQFLKEYKAQ